MGACKSLARLGSILEASLGHLGASWRRLGASWRHLGASWRRLGGVLERIGASWRRLEASWSDLEPSCKRFGPMLKTLKTIGIPMFLDTRPLVEASWRHLGASWSVLEPSWSCLGAAAGADATFDATEAASKLLRAASKRSWIDLKLLRSALGSISTFVVPVSFSRRKTRCRKRIYNIYVNIYIIVWL